MVDDWKEMTLRQGIVETDPWAFEQNIADAGFTLTLLFPLFSNPIGTRPTDSRFFFFCRRQGTHGIHPLRVMCNRLKPPVVTNPTRTRRGVGNPVRWCLRTVGTGSKADSETVVAGGWRRAKLVCADEQHSKQKSAGGACAEIDKSGPV